MRKKTISFYLPINSDTKTITVVFTAILCFPCCWRCCCCDCRKGDVFIPCKPRRIFFTCFVKKDDGKEKKDALRWLDGLAGVQLLLFVRVLYFYVYALGGILLLCIGEGVVSCVTLERYHLSCWVFIFVSWKLIFFILF